MGLIQRSISAGILIILIFMVRRLAHDKISKRIFPLLWKVAALRLLFPFYIPFPAFKLFPVKQMVWTAVGGVTNNPLTAMAEGGNTAYMLSLNPEAVWVVGMIIVGAVFIHGYIRTSFRLRESIPLPCDTERNIHNWMKEDRAQWNTKKEVGNIRIRMLDTIATPTTFGILRPVIILPKSMDFSDKAALEYVLRHEQIHIRRMDNLWKLIMAAALCMHWFNPLAIVLYLMFNRDMELACDEKVIQSLGEKERQQYAMTLLALAEKNTSFQMQYSGFGKNAVSERIKAIMNYRKVTAIGTICAVLLLAGGVTVFVSAKESGEKPVYQMDDTSVEASAMTVSEEVTDRKGTTNKEEQTYTYQQTKMQGNISVFFKQELTEEVMKKMEDALATRQEVTSWVFVSAESAWDNFKEKYLDDAIVAEFGEENPLKESASCLIYATGNTDELVRYLESLDVVRQVSVDSETTYETIQE